MKKLLILMKQSLCLIFMVCALCVGNAQNVIRGRIVDKAGLPIPGARISVKGGTESVLSEFDGTYKMIVERKIEKLHIDYVGYNSCSVKTKDASEVVLHKTTLWNDVRKNNWMISFQMAFPEIENKQPSYGLMVGWCRNFGGYIKGVWRPSVSGSIVSLERPSDAWMTGDYYSTFYAVTAGAVIRIKSPFHLYAGLGASNREVFVEIPGMGHAFYDYNNEYYEGWWRLCLDAGLIFKIRFFMINAGVMWSPGRPGLVGNFGIGVSF